MKLDVIFVRTISLYRLYLCCKLQCFSVLTQSMSSKCIKKPQTNQRLQTRSCSLLTLLFSVYVQSAILNSAISNTFTFCRPFLLGVDLAPLLDCWIIVVVGYFIQFHIACPSPFFFHELSCRGLLLKEVLLITPLE